MSQFGLFSLRRYLPEIFTVDFVLKYVYSGCYFALAYFAVAYFGNYISAAIADGLGYPVHFNLNSIGSLRYTQGWTIEKIGLVYLSPPMFGLFVCLSSLVGFRKVSSTRTHLRTFLFWMAVHGFLLYFAFILTGIISGGPHSTHYHGFVVFFHWVFNGELQKVYPLLWFLALISLPLSLFFSMPIISLAHSSSMVQSRFGNQLTVISVLLIPAVFGGLIVGMPSIVSQMIVLFGIKMFGIVPLVLFAQIGMTLYNPSLIKVRKGGIHSTSLFGGVLLCLLVCSIGWFLFSQNHRPFSIVHTIADIN